MQYEHFTGIMCRCKSFSLRLLWRESAPSPFRPLEQREYLSRRPPHCMTLPSRRISGIVLMCVRSHIYRCVGISYLEYHLLPAATRCRKKSAHHPPDPAKPAITRYATQSFKPTALQPQRTHETSPRTLSRPRARIHAVHAVMHTYTNRTLREEARAAGLFRPSAAFYILMLAHVIALEV